MRRGSPRMFRVKRVSQAPQVTEQVQTIPDQNAVTSKTVKDLTSRGTTPPPASFFEKFPQDQPVYYPTRTEQNLSTVRYRTPSPQIHSTAEVVVQQKPLTNATTSTKTSTRILKQDDEESIIEETKTTTTVIKPLNIPTETAVVTSTVTAAPVVDTTIRERPLYRRRRRIRTISTSPLSDYTTSSTSSYTTTSTVTPRPHFIRPILPPRPPIQTTIINDPPATIVPHQRYIHRARRVRTYSGYYSSDLDHGKRKIYKSDYKYRHYYYCNWCKGRCDLPNSSCGCCEWFYGCPLWSLVLLGLLFLALLITFFTLLGLQPTINSARASETAETRILNRTQIVYGFLQNCGTQAGVPTTLALCSGTDTTTTSRFEVTAFYALSRSSRIHASFNELLAFVICYLFYSSA